MFNELTTTIQALFQSPDVFTGLALGKKRESLVLYLTIFKNPQFIWVCYLGSYSHLNSLTTNLLGQRTTSSGRQLLY